MSLDGLRAWIGEVERKLGARTRVFLILVAIAIGGAGAGIYLGIEAGNDEVGQGDLRALEERVAEGGGASAETASLQTEISQLQSEIAALRSELAATKAAEEPTESGKEAEEEGKVETAKPPKKGSSGAEGEK
jgi:hypothetical protein